MSPSSVEVLLLFCFICRISQETFSTIAVLPVHTAVFNKWSPVLSNVMFSYITDFPVSLNFLPDDIHYFFQRNLMHVYSEIPPWELLLLLGQCYGTAACVSDRFLTVSARDRCLLSCDIPQWSWELKHFKFKPFCYKKLSNMGTPNTNFLVGDFNSQSKIWDHET